MPEILDYAREAESLGYEGFWATEETGKDAFVVLALVSQVTGRMRLGTAVVNFHARTPTMIAISARTLQSLSGGRFALGIGAGGIGFTERGHGVPMERPVERARECVAIVRGLLTTRRFSFEGVWHRVREFGLREGPVEEPVPIFLAALGPRMVGLAAEVADGFVANWLTEEALEQFRAVARRSAEKGDRDPSAVRILTLLMTTVDATDDASLQAMRRAVAFYCGSKHYRHVAEISGVGPAVRRVGDAWRAGALEDAASLVGNELLEKLTLTGSAADCRRRLRGLIDAGVYPIVYPVPRKDRMLEDHLRGIRLAAGYAR
jgi:5,10-methylenetetrahydromethanopterin reductase